MEPSRGKYTRESARIAICFGLLDISSLQKGVQARRGREPLGKPPVSPQGSKACPQATPPWEALPPARLPLQRSSTSCTTLHLCRLFQLGQQHPVGLIGRLVIDALMRTPLVVPVQVVADLLLHCSAGVSVFVHMLVFHAEPQPLDKPVVTPRSSPVHAQLGS